MTLVIQSGIGSMNTVLAQTPGTLTVPIPSALTGGDMLCVAAVGNWAATSATLAPIGARTWNTTVHNTDQGLIAFGYIDVPNSTVASEIRGAGDFSVNFTGPDGATTGIVTAFRVTGADNRRFIEQEGASTEDAYQSGELTIASLDPEYRNDNTLLVITGLEYPQSSGAITATASGTVPITSATIAPADNPDGDVSYGMSSFLAQRPLSSSNATGQTDVAFTATPTHALAVVLMLRSKNRPPTIALADEWTTEVGRDTQIMATVSDADGTPVSLAWSQTGGPEQVDIPNVYSRSFTFKPMTPGVYEFSLVATDVDGESAELSTSVIVPTGASGPTAILSKEGWVNQVGSAAFEAAILSDNNDATYAKTAGLPDGTTMVLALPPIYGGSAITVTVRGTATNASPTVRRTLLLKQSDGTLVAERSYNLPIYMSSYTFTTTKTETDAITNRNAMTVTVVDEVVA